MKRAISAAAAFAVALAGFAGTASASPSLSTLQHRFVTWAAPWKAESAKWVKVMDNASSEGLPAIQSICEAYAKSTTTFASKVYFGLRSTRFNNMAYAVFGDGTTFSVDLDEVSTLNILTIDTWATGLIHDETAFFGAVRTLNNAMGFQQV